MAKYQITHSCGHTETHGIGGTNTRGQRESKAAWLATRVCGECYRAERDAARATKSAESASANAVGGMPTLTGTPKQIAWAETLRAEVAAKLLPLRAQIAERADGNPRVARAMVAAIDGVMAHTDAKWWIDQRNVTYNRAWIQAQIADIATE